MRTHRIFFLKLLRSFKENWKNFIAIIVISFLALALFSGLTINYKSLQKRVDKLYADGNIADIYLTLNSYDQNDIRQLESMEYVDEVETRSTYPGVYKEKSFNLLVNKDSNTISNPIIEDGKEGFLIDSNFASSSSISVGGKYTFSFTNPLSDIGALSLLPYKDGKSNVLIDTYLVFEVEVTGIMSHPEAVENSRFGTGIAYCSDEFLLENFNSLLLDNYDTQVVALIEATLSPYKDTFLNNQILIKSDNDEQALINIDKYYQDKGDNNNLLISLTKEMMPGNVGIQSDIEQAKKLTFVFPVIFFLVSVLVILTTLSQMIAKERTQIGTMKAIGVSKGQIFWHYISYAIFLTTIGAILGLIIGPLFIPSVMNIKYELLWSLPKVNASILSLESLLCAGILVGLSALVSYLVVRKEVNLKPVECLRPAAPKNYKTSKKVSKIFDRFSLPTRMAYRNIVRNKTKSLMVVLGTLGCSALLVCGFGIMDTLNYGINYDLTKTTPFDISLTYSSSDVDGINSQIESIEGVDKIETYYVTPVKLQGKNTYETTIDLFEGESEVFTKDYSKDGVVLSKNIADNLKVKKGDTISLIINGVKFEKVVDEVFSSCFVKGVFDLKSHYESAIDSSISDNRGWVITKDSKQNEDIANKIKEIAGLESIITNKEQREYANELLSSIHNMTLVIEVFAILLAVVVIFNLANLNVKERTRDIATLKVLGFNKKEISKTLITEIMALTIVGSVIGLFFGYPMCVLVLAINKTQLISFMYHVAMISYIYALLLSVGIGFIINLLIMKRANKIKMVESLKSVE